MKKSVYLICLLLLTTFGCIAQRNISFYANRASLYDANIKKVVVNNVLLSDCYLKKERFALFEIYFFYKHDDTSKLFVRINILDDFKTDYKYYGYLTINKKIFFIKGDVPEGLFVRTKFVQKFAYGGGENIAFKKCPSWNFYYRNKKLCFISCKCD